MGDNVQEPPVLSASNAEWLEYINKNPVHDFRFSSICRKCGKESNGELRGCILL